MRMRGIRKCYVVIMAMIQIISWICATSRPIASTHVSFHQEIISPQVGEDSYVRPSEEEEMERGRRIGSKPPSCEKKCYGCEPCEAIQVPTVSSIPHLSPHYANYQPEGWRCHCAP